MSDGKIDPFMSYQDMMFKRFDEGNTEILFARPGGCNYSYYEGLQRLCVAAVMEVWV